ncbi:unnamed protein product [Heligmosomoides polygyrus]|uniref:Helitron_like_N domain-containing protein n=1 Tax=Heligmosomoides polygyrus TaxID=6339 RepID=A0A183FI11_HELPZ|nr:unnamed protein product [Heligmosomoides polygyrus]
MEEAEAALRRSANAERQRRVRAGLSQEQRAARRAANAARQRRDRAQLSEEQLAALRAANTARQRRDRAHLSQEQTVARRAANTARQRRTRDNMSETESAVRRASDTKRRRRIRMEMNDERTAVLRVHDAESHRRARAAMTLEQRTAATASRQLRRVVVQQSSTGIARLISERPMSHRLGDMNHQCSGCGALHFSDEKTAAHSTAFNMCCNFGRVSMQVFENFPLSLQQLYMGTDRQSCQFLKNMCRAAPSK